MTPHQKFEGHIDNVTGVIHLPGRQRIITCSRDGSLRVWNSESGKQIGEAWWDGGAEVQSIALSPDGKKVVSGYDDAVRLWDIDTCTVIAKWTGHTQGVLSVCWSQDGRRVLRGSSDGTARQWDVKNGETILEPIMTGYHMVFAAVFSPDMALVATGGCVCGSEEEPSVKIWDAKTGELVATLKGHKGDVKCLAWTKDRKTLISGDHSIRTWDTTKWEQTAVLDEHTSWVNAIAISPNDRILASVSNDGAARLWNLDNGKPISSPLQHPDRVNCVSFSADGKLLATGCSDKNAYSWDVTAIIKEAGLDDLLSDPKSALRANATRPPIQIRPPANRVPQRFFDGVPPAHSSARSPNSPGDTFFSRLFHRSPSTANDTSPSSPLDWARNLSKWRGRSDEGTELQEHSPAVVEVPYTRGKPRNASARGVAFAKQKQKQIQAMKPLHSKVSTAGSSQPTKPDVTQPSLQPQAAVSSSSTRPTTSMPPSHSHAMIRHPGLWTRFWLFIGCISPEYTDGHQ